MKDTMHDRVIQEVRTEIKSGLKMLTPQHQAFFKRMYSHDDLDKPIDIVVDDMPEDYLDRALAQVKRTIENIGL